MKLLQYHGPWVRGYSINIPTSYDRTYVHIGIQLPERSPLECLKTAASRDTDIMINGTTYRVNDRDILEFADMRETSLKIQFLKDMPKEAILDIACLDASSV